MSTTTSKESYRALLDDTTGQARVLDFPKGHCWSSAIGFLQTAQQSLFVKDRDDDESICQQVLSLVGQEFTKPFQSIDPVVASSYSIERPELDELAEDGPGYKLWKLKEAQWKLKEAKVDALRARKQAEEKKDEEELDEEASVVDEKKPAPSDHDCWQLEEAAVYCRSKDELVAAENETVSQSLRRKLRLAARRSGTGCLDLFTALLYTKFGQDSIREDPEWKCYQSYGLLENPEDALTAAETDLLFREKLRGVAFEVALLFAAAVALPDVNVENMALQEISEEGGSPWHLRVLHFDTGILPVSAGVSLEPLNLITESGLGFEFLGGDECTGYFFPVLLSLPAVNDPLSSETLEGLQKVDSEAIKTLLAEGLSDDEVFEEGLGDLGEIVQQRVESIKEYAMANPKSSLRDVLFHAVAAWKRDWPAYEEGSESAEWINEILEWSAEEGK